MKKTILAILCLVMAFGQASAQYVAEDPAAAGMSKAAIEACTENLRNNRTGEICFMTGIGVMAAGFLGGSFVAGAENPNKVLSVASEVALVGGAGVAATGALMMFCHEIPAYRVGYCATYATEAQTMRYIRGANAGKALICTGVGLFGAGLGTYLTMYHRGTAFEGNKHWVYDSMTFSGIALTLTGAVVAVIADNRYVTVAKREWKKQGCPQAYVTLGPTNSGLGLACNF